MLKILSNSDLADHLVNSGFSKADAEKAVLEVSNFFKNTVDAGDGFRFNRIITIKPSLQRPRCFRDNINHRDVYFGERILYTAKVHNNEDQ